MRYLGVLIIIIPVFLYLFKYRKASFFSPSITYSWLYVLKVVIAVIYFANVSNIITEEDFLRNAMLSDNIFLEYCLLQSIGYCIIIAVLKNIPPKSCNRSSLPKVGQNKILGQRFFILGILLYFVGLVGFVLIMNKIGGVFYFVSNLHIRRALVQDLDYESMLLSVLSIAPLLIIYSKSLTGKKINYIDILMIIMAGLMTGLGGRKALLILVIQSFFIYNFTIRPIKISQILKVKYILGCLILFIFFSFYSKLRAEDATASLIANPVAFFEENNSGFVESVTNESYVPFYIGVIDYFENHEKWGGSSFEGLLTAFIPSSLYQDKPPIDDGMYLFSIGKGRTDIKPIMPTRKLDFSSWPLETFGSMYANFGPLGYFVGIFFVGIILLWSYKKMIKTNYSFLYLLLYVHLLFNFEISTLRIVQALITFISLFLISKLIKKL